MDMPTFTLIHVLISVLGIIAGLVVVGGLMAGRLFDGWTRFFLATTLLTSLTGFGFPIVKVGAPHIVGAISLVVLAIGIAALYWKRLAGGSRTAYVVTAVIALYLNVFVLLVQLLAKIPALNTLAPQGSAAFGVTQLVVLGLFVWLGWAAVKGFRSAR